jgi:hypothetical protein
MNTTEKILAIIVVILIIIVAVVVKSEHDSFKPPLNDCSLLTNETYDNYSNSHVCRFNGTGWEPLFGNKGVHLWDR